MFLKNNVQKFINKTVSLTIYIQRIYVYFLMLSNDILNELKLNIYKYRNLISNNNLEC